MDTKENFAKGTIKRKAILLIQLRQLGDILLCTPAIREIKKEFPDYSISFLCHQMGASILHANPYLDEIITYREKSSWADLLKLFSMLRKKNYFYVIDFMNNPRSAILSFLCKSQHKISIESSRAWAYHQTIPRPPSSMYGVQSKFQLLQKAGFRPKNQGIDFPWNKEHLSPLQQLVNTEAFSSKGLRVVLSPTHRRVERKWPLSNFISLAEKLVQEWDAAVTWVWGPGEEEEIDKLISQCSEKTFKAPKSTLAELAAIMANHDLFIGNSNGPSHVAVSTKICTLQLHGHTNALSWCPMNTEHQAIQSPDYQKEQRVTLEKITVTQVWQKLGEMKNSIDAKASHRQHHQPFFRDWQQAHHER